MKSQPLYVVSAAMVVMLLSLAPVIYLTLFSRSGLAPLSKTLIGQAIEALIIILFITLLGWWQKTGIRHKFSWKAILLMWPIVLLITVQLLQGVRTQDFSRFAGFAALALIIGFCEESMFRGVIFTALRERGKLSAIFVSSALFGLAHAINILLGFDIRLILADVALTASFGLVFATAYVRTGSLKSLILIHALMDFSSFITRDSIMQEAVAEFSWNDILGSAVITLILGGWGIYLAFKKICNIRGASL